MLSEKKATAGLEMLCSNFKWRALQIEVARYTGRLKHPAAEGMAGRGGKPAREERETKKSGCFQRGVVNAVWKRSSRPTHLANVVWLHENAAGILAGYHRYDP